MVEENPRKIFLEGEQAESRSGVAPAGAGAAAPLTLLRKSSSSLSFLLLLLVALGSLLAAAPAAATLVVFEDGRLVRVESYDVVAGLEDGDGDRLSMKLFGGGSMTVSLDVVDRIVDEEYERPVPVPERDERLAGEMGPPAARSFRAFSENLSLSSPSPYSSQILSAAKEHRVDPAFIAAVIRAESNGVSTAVSRKGARGLMQLMPATARRLGVRKPFDPKENIRGGTAYLAELAARFGDSRPDLVLAAYNAGERAVDEHKGIPPYRETREYVRKVLALWAGAAPAAAAAAAAF